MEIKNNTKELTSRELISLFRGINKNDKEKLYKEIKEKSNTEFVYEHAFIVNETTPNDLFDAYVDIEITESIQHRITKITKLKDGGDVIQKPFFVYSDSEEISKKEEKRITETIISKINDKIYGFEEIIKDYKKAIDKEKDFLKREFKNYYRLKKLENITDND